VLEGLPTDILLEVINELAGNDQIMAALSCKTIAAVVETSTIRKIANITHYRLKFKDRTYCASVSYYYGTSSMPEIDAVQWRQYGFQDKSRLNGFYAPIDQYNDLKSAIGQWLGPNYRFCRHCRKFRTLQKTFWRNFAEYENPGITKRPAEQSYETVKQLIEVWNDTSKDQNSHWDIGTCPAHELLKERHGKRVIKAA
jgi:hypothetical protein